MRHTAHGKEVPDNGNSTPDETLLPDGQKADHWVLSPEERQNGWVRPYRESYVHNTCGTQTRMPKACAETYAKNPKYYGSTFCCGCRTYFSVTQFEWEDGSGTVGS